MSNNIFIPELEHRAAANQIALCEELELFLRELEDKRPKSEDVEARRAWVRRVHRVKRMANRAHREIEKYLNWIRNRNMADGCINTDGKVSPWWENLERYPSAGLKDAQDYILYRYVMGYFPEDMERYEIEKTELELRDQKAALNEMVPVEFEEAWQYQFWVQRMETLDQQLEELADLKSRCIPDDWDGVRMDECADEDEDGSAVCLFWIPDVTEEPENMLILELTEEIERQEYNLACLKAVEHGEEGVEKPFNWAGAVESVTALIQKLRGALEQRLTEAQGERLHAGVEKTPADEIIAGWYLDEFFPGELSNEQMMKVESWLREELSALEYEESGYERLDQMELWQYRWDLKAEQLEQIQNMMWNSALDGEVWAPEETA